MAVIDIFSKRQKRLRGELPDTYTYTELPETLRVQVVHILSDCGVDEQIFENVARTLYREYGVFQIHPSIQYGNFTTEVCRFLLDESDVERVFDAIELLLRALEDQYGHYNREWVDDVIDELNIRFKQSGVGYEYVEGSILRIDSEYTHAEVVKPALLVLRQPQYSGAQEEYLSAHAHYRARKYKECLNDCLKAYESTMKVICDAHEWELPEGASAKKLVETCFNNDLVPPFWQEHFSDLKSHLINGIPKARNKLSGHGQGASKVDVPDHLAAYMLHMTAATILFLAESSEALAGHKQTGV